MTIVVDAHKLVFYSVPKAASSSIKQFGHEVKTGQKARDVGVRVKVHDLYPIQLFDEIDHVATRGYHRVAVVRDPVSRLISCYQNKLLQQGQAHLKVKQRLADAGIEEMPTFEQFVRRLDEYGAVVGMLLGHTRPLVELLGTDPSYFARIYRIDELDALEADIRARTGTTARIPQANQSRERLPEEAVTPALRRVIEDRYKDDYATFGSYFEQAA